MLLDGSCHRTLERMAAASDPQSRDAILREICQEFGLQTAAYLGLGIPGMAPDLPFATVTYSNEWVLRYIEANYLDIDPVLVEGRRSILPMDWSALPRATPGVRKLFAEAREAGLGSQGLTIPIRGRHGETALFSVTVDVRAVAWERYKRRHLPALQILGVFFHDLVLRSEGYPPQRPALSARETECLQWAARGKSFEDIADILGLTARGVKFHLDLARHKLCALNVTHAVARALALQMIGPPD